MKLNEHYIEIKKENIKFAGKTKEEKKLNEMIYDLTLEIDSLQQENKELKEQYLELEDKYIKNLPCCNEEDCSLYNHAINTDYILTEFEKWLKEKIKYWEQQEEIWIKEGFMKFGGEANSKIIFKSSLSSYSE